MKTAAVIASLALAGCLAPPPQNKSAIIMPGFLDLAVAPGHKLERSSTERAEVRVPNPLNSPDSFEFRVVPYLDFLLASGWTVAEFDRHHSHAVLKNSSGKCLRLTPALVVWPEFVGDLSASPEERRDEELYFIVSFERGQCFLLPN